MGKGMLKNLATKLDATFVIWNRFRRAVLCTSLFCSSLISHYNIFICVQKPGCVSRNRRAIPQLRKLTPFIFPNNYTYLTSPTAAQITIANTPADVVKACDVTYSMLSTVEASIAVVSLLSCAICCPHVTPLLANANWNPSFCFCMIAVKQFYFLHSSVYRIDSVVWRTWDGCDRGCHQRYHLQYSLAQSSVSYVQHSSHIIHVNISIL